MKQQSPSIPKEVEAHYSGDQPFARIDVDKSSSHHLSRNEIASCASGRISLIFALVRDLAWRLSIPIILPVCRFASILCLRDKHDQDCTEPSGHQELQPVSSIACPFGCYVWFLDRQDKRLLDCTALLDRPVGLPVHTNEMPFVDWAELLVLSHSQEQD